MEPAVTGDYSLTYQQITESRAFDTLFYIGAFLISMYAIVWLLEYLFEPEKSLLDRLPIPKDRRKAVAILSASGALLLLLAGLIPNPLNPTQVQTVSKTSPVSEVVVDTIKDRRDGMIHYGEYGRHSVKIADTTPLTKIFPEESLLPATDVITLIKLNSKTYYFEGYVPSDRVAQMMTEAEMKRVDGTTTPDVIGYMSDIAVKVN